MRLDVACALVRHITAPYATSMVDELAAFFQDEPEVVESDDVDVDASATVVMADEPTVGLDAPDPLLDAPDPLPSSSCPARQPMADCEPRSGEKVRQRCSLQLSLRRWSRRRVLFKIHRR
jgi:hypothetical protein